MTTNSEKLLSRNELIFCSNENEASFLFEQKLNGVEFNYALRDHAIQQQFDFALVLDQLYIWADRFNNEFDLRIGQSAIAIEAKNKRVLGTYRPRNGFGLTHEIIFNLRHLIRPSKEILATLLHEQLHHWQSLHGVSSKTGWFHNFEYTNKAASLGMFVTNRGVLDREASSTNDGFDADGHFLSLLKKFGIDDSAAGQMKFWKDCGVSLNESNCSLVTDFCGIPASKGRNKKWRCLCTNIRAAVQVEAVCLKCNHSFKQIN